MEELRWDLTARTSRWLRRLSGSAARFFYSRQGEQSGEGSGFDGIEIVVVQCSSWETRTKKAAAPGGYGTITPKGLLPLAVRPIVITWNTLLFESINGPWLWSASPPSNRRQTRQRSENADPTVRSTTSGYSGW